MPSALPLLLCAYCLGIAAGDALALGPAPGRLGLLAALGLLVLGWWRGRPGLGLLALALGLGLAAQARRPAPLTLTEGPVRADGQVLSAPEPGPGGVRLRVAITALEPAPDRPFHLLSPPAQVLLTVRGPLSGPLGPGDRVRLRAALRPPDGLYNPGAGDARRRAAAEGLHAVASLRPEEIVRWEGPPAGGPSARVARLRARLLAAVEARLGPAEAGVRPALVAALALGARAALPAPLEESFRRAGVYHVLSVSGLHLAVASVLCYAGLLFLVRRLSPLCRRVPARRLAALGAIPAVVLYTGLTGAAVATVRAAGVAVLGFLAVACGRRARLGEVLAGALFLILGPFGPSCPFGAGAALGAPLSLFDPALQLSVAATLGVAYLRPRPVPFAAGRGPGRRLLRFWLGLVALALGATLATAPLCALHFGEFQGAGLLGNVAVVPLGELVVVPAGLLGAVLSLGSPALGGLLLELAGLGAAAMAWLAERVAGLGLSGTVPAPGAAALLLWTAGLLWIARRGWAGDRWGAGGPALPPARAWGRGWAGAWLLGLALLVYLVPWQLPRLAPRGLAPRGLAPLGLAPGAWPGQALQATFLDVGQGDAAVLELPGGEVVVVDGGGATFAEGGEGDFDPGEQVLLPYLRRRGIGRVDLVVLSHPHPDHLGGLRQVVARMPVGALWTAEAGPTGPARREPLAPAFLALLEEARRRGVRVEVPRPMALGGVRIEPLAPCGPPHLQASGRGVASGCAVRPDPDLGHNDNSLVLRVAWAGRALLLPGDLELAGELRLLEHLDGRPDGAALRRADVLKVPHHCSRTSSSESLLREVAPRLAVCSLGRRNRFGFPHAEVVARYRALGVPLLRTDERGAVTVRITAAGRIEASAVLSPPR